MRCNFDKRVFWRPMCPVLSVEAGIHAISWGQWRSTVPGMRRWAGLVRWQQLKSEVPNCWEWDGMGRNEFPFCFTLFDFPTARKPFPLTSLTHRLPTFKHFKLRTAATSKIWGVAVVEDLFAKSLSCTHHGIAISLHVVISVVTPTVWAVRMLSEILWNPMKLALSSSR